MISVMLVIQEYVVLYLCKQSDKLALLLTNAFLILYYAVRGTIAVSCKITKTLHSIWTSCTFIVGNFRLVVTRQASYTRVI